MKNKQLLELRKALLTALDQSEIRQSNLPHLGQRAACSVLVMLSAKIDENEPDAEINQKLNAALTIALKIDNKQLSELDNTSKQVIEKLTEWMTPNVENAYIGTLVDAVNYLHNKADVQNQSQLNHVRRVLQAIEHVHQSSQPIPNQVVALDVVDDDQTFRFYFHGENYPNEQVRKDTIGRLYATLITSWNDAVETGQLDMLINNIEAGPCIEGATRNALQKLADSIAQTTVSSDFDTAVGLYYRQAAAMLDELHLPKTFATLRETIVAAYDGTRCVARANKPDVISTQTVDDFIRGIELHETTFAVDDDAEVVAAKQAIQTLLNPFSIFRRRLLLETLTHFAAPELLASLAQTLNHYRTVLRTTLRGHELTTRKVNETLASMYAADLFNIPLTVRHTIVTSAAEDGNEELLTAILESKKVNYDLTLNDGLSVLGKLLIQEETAETLLSVIQKNPILAQQFSAGSLCRPFTQGEYQGSSPLLLLFDYGDEVELLREMLQRNPGLYQGFTAEALCRPSQYEHEKGMSALYRLCSRPETRPLFREMLQKNPNLYNGITAEALCRPVEGDYADESALWILCDVAEGIVLLKDMLQHNPSLYSGISAEALCRPVAAGNNQGVSPLKCLCDDADGIALLRDMLQHNPSLYSGISAEALCRPAAIGKDQGISPLWLLSLDPDEINLLRDMLRQNPSLYQGVTAEALCRPAAQGEHQGKSPLYFLCTYPAGIALLRDLLQHNPSLYQGMTAEVLYRPALQGNNQGVSPFWNLCVTPEGIALLKDMLLHNPGLYQGMNAEALCRTAAPGKSPLLRLCNRPEGIAFLRDLLQQILGLAQGITAEALCRPLTQDITGISQGTSPLWCLCSSSEGIALLSAMLQHNPSLCQGISAESLCREVGEPPQSALSLMMKTEQGQGLLVQLTEGNRMLLQHPKIEEAFRAITLERGRRTAGDAANQRARKRERSPSPQLFTSATTATNLATGEDEAAQQAMKKKK